MTQFFKVCSYKSFGEDICNLLSQRDIGQLDYLFLNLLKDKMSVYFNMFGFIMMQWVLGNSDGSLIVT